MKKRWLVLFAIIIVIAIVLAVYPHIEFKTDDNFIACRYSDDISEFEDDISLDERYVYNEKNDITILGYDFHKFLFFHVIVMEYEEGNLIETMYVLDESYIEDFIKNAEITENPGDVDVAELIKGKKAVVSNTRYIPEDYSQCDEIFYKLNDRYEVMLVYEVDDLLVLQVGYPDEGPQYIAYE